MTNAPLLATPANMRRLESGEIPGPDDVTSEHPFAYSPLTGERFSASSGDYWNLPDDLPLRDDRGEPMVLAYISERVIIVGAPTEGTDAPDATYEEFIDAARGLLEPGEEHLNPEYVRGLVNLIAEVFGKFEMPTGERMEEVARDMQLPREHFRYG